VGYYCRGRFIKFTSAFLIDMLQVIGEGFGI
jgi:hypothetical protein